MFPNWSRFLKLTFPDSSVPNLSDAIYILFMMCRHIYSYMSENNPQILLAANFFLCRLVKFNLLTVQCGNWVLKRLDEEQGGASVVATLSVTQHYKLLPTWWETYHTDRQTDRQGPIFTHQAPRQSEGQGGGLQKTVL
jgi:hypothetical protein